MGKKDIDIDDIVLYTTLTFTIDNEVTIIIKNLETKDLELFTDKEKTLKSIISYEWYMFGAYDNITVFGLDFTILSKTKKKIEIMVKRD